MGSSARGTQGTPAPIWYDAQFYPASTSGYVYIVRLGTPYKGGVKRVRVGGHYQIIDGKRRLVGGTYQERPQMVYVYVGWSPDPWKRFDQHMRGRGARILAYLAAIGVPMSLEVVTPGGRDLEAEFKRKHNGLALLRSVSPAYASVGK